jgi:hypothetical protein
VRTVAATLSRRWFFILSEGFFFIFSSPQNSAEWRILVDDVLCSPRGLKRSDVRWATGTTIVLCVMAKLDSETHAGIVQDVMASLATILQLVTWIIGGASDQDCARAGLFTP